MSGLEDPETRPDEPIVPRAVPLPEPDGDHPAEPGAVPVEEPAAGGGVAGGGRLHQFRGVGFGLGHGFLLWD